MSDAAAPLIARRSGPLTGEAVIPGDKSISHRALIFGALCVGETTVRGLLEGEDVLATAAAIRALGAETRRTVSPDGPVWTIQGAGVGGLTEPDTVIDCGNSGTGARLLLGLVATYPFAATFTGDASLRSRPMGRVLTPLERFGATSLSRSGGRLPLTLLGAREPAPIEYTLPVASAQVKSAILLAGLNAPGETTVIEPTPTRDHTETMLAGFGASVAVEDDGAGGRVIRLLGQPDLRPQEIVVPSDPSSAAFPIAAALIVEGSDVSLTGVGVNPTRAGLLATLKEMGADIVESGARVAGGEPVVDIRVRGSSLRGVEVPPERAASMIDEYPILSVIAAFAEGETVMRGVGELRVKETDRIAAMATGLRACGVEVGESEDEMRVVGRGPGGVVGGAAVAAQLDHRIAMSFAVLGLAAQKPVTVDDAAPIATSFPGFPALMTGLGASMEIVR